MPLQALEVIREEHRWIARMLDCLERLIEDGHARGRLEAEASAELLALFAHFADGVHQQREETCLFPRLLARAASVDERLALGRLCGEHEAERIALRGMGERLLGAIYGRTADLTSFLGAAAVFVRLHRQHLIQENLRLLPLAEHLLTPEDDERLLEAYRYLDSEGPGLGAICRRIAELCTHLGVEPAAASEP